VKSSSRVLGVLTGLVSEGEGVDSTRCGQLTPSQHGCIVSSISRSIVLRVGKDVVDYRAAAIILSLCALHKSSWTNLYRSGGSVIIEVFPYRRDQGVLKRCCCCCMLTSKQNWQQHPRRSVTQKTRASSLTHQSSLCYVCHSLGSRWSLVIRERASHLRVGSGKWGKAKGKGRGKRSKGSLCLCHPRDMAFMPAYA